MVSPGNSSEKFENRIYKNNLTTFLNFDFRPSAKEKGQRLVLAPKNKDGRGAYQVLKNININELSWFQRQALSFNKRLDIRKIGQLVEHELRYWNPEKEEEKIALEHQVACLAAKLKKIEFPFNNPFQKTLQVVIRYKDADQTKEEITKIPYDRLTSKNELSSKINEVVAKEISLSIPMKTKIGGDVSQLPVRIPPGDIFKSVVREPENLFDPVTEPTRVKERTITFNYQDPDQDVIHYLILQVSTNSLPFAGNPGAGFTLSISDNDKKEFFKMLMPNLQPELDKIRPPKIYLDTSKMGPPKPPAIPFSQRIIKAISDDPIDKAWDRICIPYA